MKTIFDINELHNVSTQDTDGQWIPARPLNAHGIIWRIKAAIHVLRGKAVPIKWR